VDSDAQPAGRDASRSVRRPRLRRTLRLVGLSFQVLLCAALVVWGAATGEAVFAAVAVVLLVVATVLLIRETRAGPSTPSALSAGADLGEGAADDDPDEAEDSQ
jgi:hypothetical protein